MKSWTAVVLAAPAADGGAMVSRLPTHLHPAAGRPLIWHTVSSLARSGPPDEVVIVASDVTTELFDDVPTTVRIVEPASLDAGALDRSGGEVVLVHASATIETGLIGDLLASSTGAWVGDGKGTAGAIVVEPQQLPGLLDSRDPFTSPLLSEGQEVGVGGNTLVVRTRADLARANRRIRDQLVQSLMESGVTFLLPDSVLVDVAVRVGRDSIVYPGVVLEGQTTIGEETVVGPGCRIIDSWVGSGVELKGWNYLANTSVRNRAILEPYVRRGFD